MNLFCNLLMNIFTIIGGFGVLITLHDKFNKVDLSIRRVANTARTLNRMLACVFHPDENECDVTCEFSNYSSSVRHVTMCGYLFHFGSVFSCGRDCVQCMHDFDISRLYALKNVDYNFEPGSVTTVDLKVGKHLLVSDKDKYAKRCVRIGMILRHSIVAIRYTWPPVFTKSIYYDVTTGCKLSFYRYICLLVNHLCGKILNVLESDYDFIPDDACTCIDTICAGFDNIDLSNEKVLSNCGDFDLGPFYSYLHGRHTKSFMCLSSKTYMKSDVPFVGDDHSVHGWIYNIRPFCCFDDEYYSRHGNQPFNIVDFRHPLMSDLLDEHTYVMTCPPKSLFCEYVQNLLLHGINFKILCTYDDVVAFGTGLLVDGGLFDAYFHVPFSFSCTNVYKKHRFYIDKNGEPMIKVKNCCWVVPNYES